MNNIDYEEIGLRSGVEIHQQLKTEKKLFCRCPAGLYSDKYNVEVLRHMRPTLSEMGVYDGTALMEFKKKKEIIYRLKNESVCTYEMDDTPPFLINENAIDITIEIALLLGSTIVDEMHIARKQYLDGSIPTGFQRTAIIGMGGKIPFDDKEIRIRQVALEEDSCREISDRGHTITFRTDRLGMPLIEVVTEPDMRTPEEVSKVVKKIGQLMRLTKKVRRGLGKVRQDVNVSIKGGRRVEIKGVPRYQVIPPLVHNEALRQKRLLEIKDEMKRRDIDKTIDMIEKDLTFDLRNTRSEHLKEVFDRGWKIRGIRLPKMNGILNRPTQPAKTFANEISDRVRVIACTDHIPTIYHTDNWPEYKAWQKDWLKVKRILGVSEEDAAVIVWGGEEDVITAASEVKIRILEALDGVPHETRKARFDGTTDFERILPGADRMYPDTDHPPVKIEKNRVKNILENLPDTPWKIKRYLSRFDLPNDVIEKMILSPHLEFIYRLDRSDMDNMNLRRVIIYLVHDLARLSKKINLGLIDKEDLYKTIKAYGEEKINKAAVYRVLDKKIKSSELTLNEIMEEYYLDCSDELINEVVQFAGDQMEYKKGSRPKDMKGFLMGKIVNKFSKIPPKLAANHVDKILK